MMFTVHWLHLMNLLLAGVASGTQPLKAGLASTMVCGMRIAGLSGYSVRQLFT